MRRKAFLLTCTFLFIGAALLAEQPFNGKTVLITGASRGIGLKSCEMFAENGYKVYGTLRENSKSESIRALQQKYPERIEILFLDLRDSASIKQAVGQIISKEGNVDILVNNAGFGLFGALESCELEKIQDLFEVNVFGTVRVLQEVLPHMRRAEKGRIINVGSRSGFRPAPSLAAYAASKFAIEAMTETLAFNLEPWNIKVSIIEPGPVATEFDEQTVYGTRFEEDPYYPYFVKYGLTLEDGMTTAQPTEEVAAQILEIAEHPQPNLRYQTSEKVRSQAAKVLVDPTGALNLQSLKEGLSGK